MYHCRSAHFACPLSSLLRSLLSAQVEAADLVVVNKTDLASAEELRTTEAVVRSLAPGAELFRATCDARSSEITSRH